jgi:hypothetical protein
VVDDVRHVRDLGLAGPGVVTGPVDGLRKRQPQTQAGDTLRVARRNQRCRAAGATGCTEDDLLHSRRIHDGEDVVGLLLERGHVVDPIGQAQAAPLEECEAAVARHGSQIRFRVRVGPQQIEVHDLAAVVHELSGP